ncbi:MAG: stage III sporulation protein AA [Gorillibacterium sp.]|nr:stage III sporulation protein AA [Gorillibacterium sp.]
MPDSILDMLPTGLKTVLTKLPQGVLAQLEEIRVREGRSLEILYGGGSSFPAADGTLSRNPSCAYTPGREDCARLLDLLTRHSLYSFEEELRRGFITVAGGHRVGLAGRTILEAGKVRLIRDVSGFNIRIARQVKGCGAAVLPQLLDKDSGTIHHTLVVSPPQQGKTTLIRDLIRMLSEGSSGLKSSLKVAVIDERSEIAACVRGVPTFDLGPRTDVMDGCPKAEGMMMMIRSMSPEVIAVDEIGTLQDADAVWEAMNAGIRVIATAHGRNLQEVKSRPALKQLLDGDYFTKMVLLTRQKQSFMASVSDLRVAKHQARSPDVITYGGSPC